MWEVIIKRKNYRILRGLEWQPQHDEVGGLVRRLCPRQGGELGVGLDRPVHAIVVGLALLATASFRKHVIFCV